MKLIYRWFRLVYRVQQLILKRFTVVGMAILLCSIATIVIGLDTKQTMAYQVFTFLVAILLKRKSIRA